MGEMEVREDDGGERRGRGLKAKSEGELNGE